MDIYTEASISLALMPDALIDLQTYDNQLMTGVVQSINVADNALFLLKLGRLTAVKLENIKDLRLKVSADNSMLVRNARFFLSPIGAVKGLFKQRCNQRQHQLPPTQDSGQRWSMGLTRIGLRDKSDLGPDAISQELAVNCGSGLAREGVMSVAIDVGCAGLFAGKTANDDSTFNFADVPHSLVGASLLAMTVGQPKNMLADPPPSLAGQLPQELSLVVGFVHEKARLIRPGFSGSAVQRVA
jgi:hypothetical protein